VVEIVRFKRFVIRYDGGQHVGDFMDKSDAFDYAKSRGWSVRYIREA